MKISISLSAVLLLTFASCDQVKVTPPDKIVRLDNNTIVAFVNQKFYAIDASNAIISTDLIYDDVVFDGKDFAIIRNNKYYHLTVDDSIPVETFVARGTLLDRTGAKLFVKDKDYLRVYSNNREIDYFSIDRDYQQAAIWKDRVLISLDEEQLTMWDIVGNSETRLKKQLENVNSFSLHPVQPLIFLLQNNNEIYSYQIYADQLTLIDRLPFPVLAVNYDDSARILMVRGKGVFVFYHMDTRKIEMNQIDLLDMSYDVDSSELLVLSSNSVTVIDLITKSNIIEYKLD